SYVYFASYFGGALLNRHIDRPQCEHSISLLLDYTPEPLGRSGWPLFLDAPRGRVRLDQAIGDAVVYCGRELPHFRRALPASHTSTSFFFHYVDASFAGSLD